jgi:hypothetical protein
MGSKIFPGQTVVHDRKFVANDAPALKRTRMLVSPMGAELKIAKDAAIILLDDNFASIVTTRRAIFTHRHQIQPISAD